MRPVFSRNRNDINHKKALIKGILGQDGAIIFR